MQSDPVDTALTAFARLTLDQRSAFFRAVAGSTTATEAIALYGAMPDDQRGALVFYLLHRTVSKLEPLMIAEARRVAQERPVGAAPDFDAAIGRQVEATQRELWSGAVDTAGREFKRQRDRKSDPNIVNRDREIRERRRSNPKTWTLAKLAKQYEISIRTVRDILKAGGLR
jgi:hypothetical protein